MVLDDGVYLVIDEWLFIADRVFYPLVIGISVIAYSYADGIIGHPDTLLAVDVNVIDSISVHWVVPIVVGNDIRFGCIGIGIHLVDTGSVRCDENLIVIEGTDTVDADVHQSGWYMHDLVLV